MFTPMHLQPVIVISAIAVAFYASIITTAQEFGGDAVPDRPKETGDKFEIAVSFEARDVFVLCLTLLFCFFTALSTP